MTLKRVIYGLCTDYKTIPSSNSDDSAYRDISLTRVEVQYPGLIDG